jgi:hypothetical protein
MHVNSRENSSWGIFYYFQAYKGTIENRRQCGLSEEQETAVFHFGPENIKSEKKAVVRNYIRPARKTTAKSVKSPCFPSAAGLLMKYALELVPGRGGQARAKNVF